MSIALRHVIVKEYYDGAISGIAARADSDSFLIFFAVAWDRDSWQRVFAMREVSPEIAMKLIALISSLETPRHPIWVLGSKCATAEFESQWRDMREAALDQVGWLLVESHDLIEVSQAVVLNDEQSLRITRAIRQQQISTISEEPLLSRFIKIAFD
jgi:hypothetical protein